jgi:hypothetical protein
MLLDISALFKNKKITSFCVYMFCFLTLHERYDVMEDGWQCEFCWGEWWVQNDGFEEAYFDVKVVLCEVREVKFLTWCFGIGVQES